VATGASAAQTAAAEALTNVETRLAEQVGSCPPSFDVDTDLNLTVSVTGEQLDQAIRSIRSDSGLIGLGNDIVRIGGEKSINAYYIAAHAAWESTWGNSALATQKNNLFGYGAYDSCPFECAMSFDSKAESVEIVMTNVKEDYLTEGGQYYNGPNLRGMNVRYATDKNWMNGIASIMNSLAGKVPCD
jgi:beta-N-acetylglucosaminidase